MEYINDSLPKSTGAPREFGTGAHRDNATGKGRCDLLPLQEVAAVMDDPVIQDIADWETGDYIGLTMEFGSITAHGEDDASASIRFCPFCGREFKVKENK